MARIIADPDELRQVATQFQQASADSHGMVQQLSGRIQTLDANWDGLSNQKFMADFDTWQLGMRQYVTLLDEINQHLLALAQRFEDADRPS